MGALGILLWIFRMIGSGRKAPRNVIVCTVYVGLSYDIMLLFLISCFMSMLDLLFVVLKFNGSSA